MHKSIQSHGVLLVCLRRNRTIVQCSENAVLLLGVPYMLLVGRSLDSLFAKDDAAYLIQELAKLDADDPLEYLPPLSLAAGRRYMNVSVYRTGDYYVLELEPEDLNAEIEFFEQTHVIQKWGQELFEGSSRTTAFEAFLEKLRLFGGFDRCLMYRRDDQDEMEAIAESRAAGWSSLLDQRLPAEPGGGMSRKPDLRVWLRMFPDIQAPRFALVPASFRGQTSPDLFRSFLASPLPSSLHSLLATDVRLVMTLSLMVAGSIWGLVVCHEGKSRIVPPTLRLFCEMAAQLLSLHIEMTEPRFPLLEMGRHLAIQQLTHPGR